MSSTVKYKKLYVLSATGKKQAFSLPLKDSIKIGNRSYEIQLKSDEKHGAYILWKNRKYPVEIIRSRQNRYEILFNDVSYTFTVETPFSLQRQVFLKKTRKEAACGTIRAPMPGKIVDIAVKEGNKVSVGETLVVLEAMKMQNEITSTVSGIILSVAVKPGMNIMKDDLLVEIAVAK